MIYDLPSAYENLWTEPSLNATATYNQVEEISLEWKSWEDRGFFL
ncbi:MAG: hypothetical protein ACLRMZ_10590 [Blautia marasmi]